MTNNTNYELKTSEVSENEVKQLAGNLQDTMIYIAPESSSSELDLLNHYSADMKKLAAQYNIPCQIIRHGSSYKYLDLKDADIVLPFLISLSASACYDILKYFITKYFLQDSNKLKVKIITKSGKSFKRKEISGKPEGVLKALELLKNEEA